MKPFLAAVLLACMPSFALAQFGPYDPDPVFPVFTGLWWNPSESGWGLNTTHQGEILFATLFTYAPDGRPMWLVASRLDATSETRFTGVLYRTTGPPFHRLPWSDIGVTEVGTMTLSYFGADDALLTYTVDGVTVQKAVERQAFAAPIPLCVAVAGSRAAEENYQDLWWNPAESGWGINLTHQGSKIFATLFTYGEAERGMWFVASDLALQSDGSFSGPLYATTGPAYDASPWLPIGFAQVGAMTLRFSDGQRGILTYDVGGTTVVKAIERQVFDAITSACR